jgi:hypothetical protein
MTRKDKFVLYQPDSTLQLEVRVEDETVWLNRQQMARLFDRDVKTIGKHINNALKEELAKIPTVANFATVQNEGNRIVERMIEHYNLDVILSVGYRVKSQKGIQFRIWSSSVLKNHLLKGYSINQRFERIEKLTLKTVQRVDEHDKKIDFFVRTSLPPVEGIYYDGQIFDAYKFVADLIKSAKTSIVLIDNYVDESVLMLLSKRNENVNTLIYTAQISEQLKLDLKKHNAQYPEIEIKLFSKSHDRFLIIDDVVYHIGASLKDLGKKLFDFSKMEMNAKTILLLQSNRKTFTVN